MKYKILQDLIILFVIICFTNNNSLGQENNIISKTKSQLKLTESNQLFYQGNIKTALLNYREIIASNPLNSKAQFGAARCYYKLNDYENAKYHVEMAFKNDPKSDEDLYYLMAEVYFRLGALEKAKINYEKYKTNCSKQKLKEYNIDLKLRQLEYSNTTLNNSNEKITITNMGPMINSKGPEYAPSISIDGKYLMFTSRRPDTKGGNVDHYYDHQYFSDIYLSKWDSLTNNWSKPSNKLGRINTEFYDASLSFKADNSIIIYRNIMGVTKSGDIYEASYSKNDSWSSPKPILYKNKAISNKINSSYFESSASITEDESFIYFVSERVSGFGKTDIYCVKKEGKNYSEPINLGNNINSPGDEKCVFIHPSGDLLFFTSNGRDESIGSYDVYYCTGGYNNWSEPKNIGRPINTTLEEKTINISKDGNTAFVGGYYSINNQGDADLYEIDISSLNLLKK